MDAAARFSKYLQDNRLRLTRERRRILDEMLRIPGHFDADDLLAHFHRQGRRVSRATLYRTLARLVEAGPAPKVAGARRQGARRGLVGARPPPPNVFPRRGAGRPLWGRGAG